MTPTIALLLSLLSWTPPGQDFNVWNVGNQLYVADARPELGIGAHQLPDNQIALLHDLNIRMVRHTMYWSQVENTEAEGVYNPEQLAYWDELVARCQREKIELLVVVHGNPPGVTWEHHDQAYRRFARFMADMATRYPQIRYWELWNEMDGAFTDIFGANAGIPMGERGKLYADMLKLAYPAIKTANPQAFVLTGGMTDTGEFPTGIYEAGGKDFFDIMAIHTYGVPVTWAFVDRGIQVREIMARFGDADKPLWNTEFGIDAGNIVYPWGFPNERGEEDGPTLDHLMLNQWRECLEAAEKYKIYAKLFPYQLAAGNERNDDGKIVERLKLPEGHTVDDYGFGIVRCDGVTPRPVYDWLKERNYNKLLFEQPERQVDVEYWTSRGLQPVGIEVNQWRRSYINIPGLALPGDYPVIISLTDGTE